MSNLEKLGYSKNSPFKKRSSIDINSNHITMRNTDIPLLLIPNNDNPILANPYSGDYIFPNSSKVKEIPLKKYQSGGKKQAIIDSLVLYNQSLKDKSLLDNIKNFKEWKKIANDVPLEAIDAYQRLTNYNGKSPEGNAYYRSFPDENGRGVVELFKKPNNSFKEEPTFTPKKTTKTLVKVFFPKNETPVKSEIIQEKIQDKNIPKFTQKELVIKPENVIKEQNISTFEHRNQKGSPIYHTNGDLIGFVDKGKFSKLEDVRGIKAETKRFLNNTEEVNKYLQSKYGKTLTLKHGGFVRKYQLGGEKEIPTSIRDMADNILLPLEARLKSFSIPRTESVPFVRTNGVFPNNYVDINHTNDVWNTNSAPPILTPYSTNPNGSITNTITGQPTYKIDPNQQQEFEELIKEKPIKEDKEEPIDWLSVFGFANLAGRSLSKRKQQSREDEYTKQNIGNLLKDLPLIDRSQKNYNSQGVFIAENGGMYEDDFFEDEDDIAYANLATPVDSLDYDIDSLLESYKEDPENLSPEETKVLLQHYAQREIQQAPIETSPTPEQELEELRYLEGDDEENTDVFSAPSLPVNTSPVNIDIAKNAESVFDVLSGVTLKGSTPANYGNNPGNIVWTEDMEKIFGAKKGKPQTTQGSKKYKGPPSYYAKFQDVKTGFEAMQWLLNTKEYKTKTLKEGLKRWIGDDEYSERLSKKYNNPIIGEMSKEQLRMLMLDISREEDGKAHKQIMDILNK